MCLLFAFCSLRSEVVLPAQAATLPATLGWFSIPNTAFGAICPDPAVYPNINGQENCSGVTNDWAGGAADTTNNRLLFTGGGHHGYYGNEIYALNLNTLTISLLDKPSDASTLDTNMNTYEPMPDGTPGARHTYGGIAYDPTAQKLRLFGGAPPSPGVFVNTSWEVLLSALNPNATGAGIWKELSPTFSGGSLSPSQFGDLLEWGGPTDDFMYLVEPFGSQVGHVWRFNRSNNTYTMLATNQTTPTNMDGTQSGAIDTLRHVFYAAGNGKFFKMNLTSGFQWTNVSGSGCNTGAAPLSNAYPGVAFDTSQNVIVVWSGGNSVLVYDPAINTCTTQTFSGGPTTTGQNGTFGRFRYFPALNVFAVCNTSGENCFALRMTSGSGTPPPPPPSASPCDVNNDGLLNVADVQTEVNMALGVTACTNPSGSCTVISVQRVVNAALGGSCVSP